MKKLGTSRLAYIGRRPYIRGADLFALFDDLVRSLMPDIVPGMIDRFRLVREVERDGAWWLGRSDADSEQMREAAATLEFVDPRGEAWFATFVEDGAPITERRPDIASVVARIDPSGDFAGNARLMPLVSRRDLIDGLIEVNKALHQETLSKQELTGDSIRLIYIEGLPLIEAAPPDPGRDVEIGHVGERRIGGRTYTLNAARVSDPEIDAYAPISICFSY
jgi:hypothetical protein